MHQEHIQRARPALAPVNRSANMPRPATKPPTKPASIHQTTQKEKVIDTSIRSTTPLQKRPIQQRPDSRSSTPRAQHLP